MATAIKRFRENLTNADRRDRTYSYARAERVVLNGFDAWKHDYQVRCISQQLPSLVIISVNLERVVDGCGAGSLDLEESPRYVIMKVIYEGGDNEDSDND